MAKSKVYDSISAEKLGAVIKETGAKKPMIVHGSTSYEKLFVKDIIEEACPEAVHFSQIQPNPNYEDIIVGLELFRRSGCDLIISVGGGSVIDSAKCIELFSACADCEDYSKAEHKAAEIAHICIPTTAGSGSEATKYAIIYKAGKKLNITHESIIPDYVFLLPQLLCPLSDYQKKATMLDAICHAVESMWSSVSNDESLVYSKMALRLIYENEAGYLKGEEAACAAVLLGSNFAGKAINITGTTLPHAMGYKLTKDYNIAHGHACVLGLIENWRLVAKNKQLCTDSRGEEHLSFVLGELDELLGGVEEFAGYVRSLGLKLQKVENAPSAEELCASVDMNKLAKHPVEINEEDIRTMYANIVA